MKNTINGRTNESIKLSQYMNRPCRLVRFGNRNLKAWRVPGTPEAGHLAMLVTQRDAAFNATLASRQGPS